MPSPDTEAHQQTVDAFLAKLRAYLLAPDHGSAGSWPELSFADIHEAEDLVERLLLLKWGRDCDNDSPVKFMMWARRLCHVPYDLPLLTGQRGEPVDAREVRLLENIGRASGAVSAYAQQISHAERQLAEIKLKRACLKAARQVYLVVYTPDDAWKAGPYGRDVPASLHATQEAAQEFAQAQPLQVQRIAVRWAIPSEFANKQDGYKDYFDEVTSHLGQVLPQHGVLSKMGLSTRLPDEQDI